MSGAHQDVPRAEHGQTNNTVGIRRVADDMPLWRLLALALLDLAGVQVEHIALGVVVGMIEGQRPMVMFTRSMTWGPSGWRTRTRSALASLHSLRRPAASDLGRQQA